MATILESLQNAEYNINHNISFALEIAKSQLHNAVDLLEKGYSIDDEIEPLLEKFGNIDDVPEII